MIRIDDSNHVATHVILIVTSCKAKTQTFPLNIYGHKYKFLHLHIPTTTSKYYHYHYHAEIIKACTVVSVNRSSTPVALLRVDFYYFLTVFDS